MATIEWQFAELRDVPSIVELAQQHFQSEIDQVLLQTLDDLHNILVLP